MFLFLGYFLIKYTCKLFPILDLASDWVMAEYPMQNCLTIPILLWPGILYITTTTYDLGFCYAYIFPGYKNLLNKFAFHQAHSGEDKEVWLYAYLILRFKASLDYKVLGVLILDSRFGILDGVSRYIRYSWWPFWPGIEPT